MLRVCLIGNQVCPFALVSVHIAAVVSVQVESHRTDSGSDGDGASSGAQIHPRTVMRGMWSPNKMWEGKPFGKSKAGAV